MKNAKRILSVVLCLLMSISMLTAIVLPTSAAAADDTLIANVVAGKPVVSGKGDYSASYAAALAVDGKASTRWNVANKVTNTLFPFEINLLGEYRLTTFEFTRTTTVLTECYWEYFVDGEWKKGPVVTDPGTGTDKFKLSGTFDEGVVAEKLRLYTKAVNLVSLYEIKVAGYFVGTSNIAYGKNVTASNQYNATYAGAKVVDGLTAHDQNRWACSTKSVTLDIDLGGTYAVDGLCIIEGARIGSYTLQYWDGSQFVDYYSEAPNKTADNTVFTYYKKLDNEVVTDKVRFAFTGNNISIQEIEVYGTNAYENIALGKTATTDNYYNNTYNAPMAFDGDSYGTRWAAKTKVDTYSIYVDLGANYYIDSYALIHATRVTGCTLKYWDASLNDYAVFSTDTYSFPEIGEPILSKKQHTENVMTDKLCIEFTGNTPSIHEIEVYGYGYCAAQSVVLDTETMTLAPNATAQLTATVLPEEALNKNVTWASDNEAVATVENGLVTAIGAGTANITVTTVDGGYTATCVVNVIKVGASIAGTYYETFAQAIAAAKSGDTIILYEDAATDYLVLDPGITLDLNGKTLTTGHAIGLKGSAIIDGSDANTGKLVIEKEFVALDKTNGSYLPVYHEVEEGTGYFTFSTISKVNAQGTWLSNVYKYSFWPMFETFVHEDLAKGVESSTVKVVLRLTWDDETYSAEQDYFYKDEDVAKVVTSFGTHEQLPDDYAQVFTATLKREDADVTAANYHISAVLISDTGVEIASAPHTLTNTAE